MLMVERILPHPLKLMVEKNLLAECSALPVRADVLLLTICFLMYSKIFYTIAYYVRFGNVVFSYSMMSFAFSNSLVLHGLQRIVAVCC